MKSKKDKSNKSEINTNLAAEFWFLSQLYRLGYEAYLTMANTKAVDIAVRLSTNRLLTFDVKGAQSFTKASYSHVIKKPKLQELLRSRRGKHHYFAFVNLKTKKNNQSHSVDLKGEPECFIVSAKDLDKIAYEWTPKKKTKTNAGGFGFHAAMLPYLCDNYNDVSKSSLQHFKQGHELAEIDKKKYKNVILNLSVFARRHHNA